MMSHEPPPVSAAATPRRAGPVQIIVTCPHCQTALDVSHLVVPTPAGDAQASVPDPASPAFTTSLPRDPPGLVGAGTHRLLRTIWPGAAPPMPAPAEAPAGASWHRRLALGGVLVALVLIIGVLMLYGGHAASRPGASPAPTPVTQASIPTDTPDTPLAAQAAVMETIRQYNAAETEAEATLQFDLITPFLDPDGSLYARRQAEMTDRIRTMTPHQTRLLDWEVGAITVTGATATVITRETWDNQELGDVAPTTATVRVTYTLRYDEAVQRWLIVGSEYQAL